MNLHLTLTLITALLVSSPVAAQYSARRNGTRHMPTSASVTSGTSTARVTANARRYRGSIR